MAAQDLPAPADLLDGKVAFVADHARIDRTHAVFSGCATLLTAARCERRVARKDAFYGIIEAYAKQGVALDVAVTNLIAVMNAEASAYAPGEGDGKGSGRLFKIPLFCRELMPYLKAAGLIPEAIRPTPKAGGK